uniref:PDZ domain-containing protein n=1 Tax=Noctiluca scintillans TaxID=2966 RepID=A0A7S1F3A8_NOCSC|mmetsp:Transcript_29113/g.76883  ORF Transcript_29113/g.76883 Transcript_29113/m.76883 type:complete len:178 (+) Transcript_29113:101-634(+)
MVFATWPVCCCRESVSNKTMLIGVDNEHESGWSGAAVSDEPEPSLLVAEPIISKDGDPLTFIAVLSEAGSERSPDMGGEHVVHRQLEVGDEFKVTMKMTPGTVFGVNISRSPNGLENIVTHIGPGLVQEWNRWETKQRVCVGDRLVSVCGERGCKSVDLLEAMKTAEVLELVFQRCA